VYRGGSWNEADFRTNGRMYGAKTTYILSIQVTGGVQVTKPSYTIDEENRVAANVQDLSALLQNLASGTSGGGAVPKVTASNQPPAPTIFWTGKQLTRDNPGHADICIATSLLVPQQQTSGQQQAPNLDKPNAAAQTVVAPAGTATTIKLTGSDPNNGNLAFVIVKKPSHGIITGTPPNLTFTPSGDYSGTDSFTFTVTNDTLTSDPATVSLTATPPAAPPAAVVVPLPTPPGGAAPSPSSPPAGTNAPSLLSTGVTTATLVSIADFNVTDEPKQWWDVSVAVPITKISEVQYSSTNGTVTPNTVNRQSVFAVADFFYPKKDMVGTKIDYWPHPLLGVSLASKPLQSLLFGGAVGFAFGEIYVGANLLKEPSLGGGLATGSTATPAQVAAGTGEAWRANFSVGLNLSVTSAFSAMKKATGK
jgi:hypothetical protein